MRKTIPILFFAVLVSNFLIFYAAFIFDRNGQKEDRPAKHITEAPGKQQLFCVSREEFDKINWTHQGREFNFNGHIFNVSHIEFSDKFVRLYVRYDSCCNEQAEDLTSQIGSRGHSHQI